VSTTAIDTTAVVGSDGELSASTIVTTFTRLRWRVLIGSVRSGGAQRVAVILGVTASAIVGAGLGVAFFVGGHTLQGDERRELLIIAPALMVIAITAIGIITGVTQPIDPRVLGTEPLRDRDLGLGLLTGSAVGPAGIGALLMGLGIAGGSLRGALSIVPAFVAASVLLVTLLLVSRTTINLLAILVMRFPRSGQFFIGIVSLVFYASFQFVPVAIANLDESTRGALSDVILLTPPGQVGQALLAAGDSPLRSLGHTVLGALWLPLLIWAFDVTTRKLLVTTRLDGVAATDSGGRRSVSALAERACGRGPIGEIAWRSVRTRMRTPRLALETFIGFGVGLAIVLVPALTRDAPGAGAVLVGGAVQLSVLFMAGNSFGSDGPALGAEVLCGLDPEVLVRGKARSIIVVAAPLSVVGPAIAAAVTGEWEFLPAGILVATGGLLAGTGGALVQSTFVPIAIPESDNPLASGDTGHGLLAAVTLAVVLVALAVVTLPIALGLLWAVDRDSNASIAGLAGATVIAGWLVLRVGIHLATRRWRRNEPEIYAAITPVS